MPRAGRTFEEGRIYHVFNRVGGGWMAFEDEKLGERFIEVLAGKGRASNIVKMRDLIEMVGVERFGVKVTELADVLGKSRAGVSCWMRRGAERRATDPSFAVAAERFEYVASEEP